MTKKETEAAPSILADFEKDKREYEKQYNNIVEQIRIWNLQKERCEGILMYLENKIKEGKNDNSKAG